jgi:hypothetical protein
MTALSSLWLPIVVSSVFVFILSSIIHMASPWHKSDYPKLPNEDKAMDALRPLSIPPGDYMVPRPSNMKDMKSPEFLDKMKKGPVMVLTVVPNGPMAMGRNMILWFLYSVVIGVAPSQPAPGTWPCSASPGSPRSSPTRRRSGRCRSGIAAPGAPRSRLRWMG